MKMLPSLCVLTYERPKYLQDTLTSIRTKTNSEYELIINDDGSKENYDIINRVLFAERVGGATIIQNPPGWNEGVGRSINKCFKVATGDLLIKIDTDLDFTEGWLEKTVKLFEENPRLGLLGLCHYHHEPVDMSKTAIDHFDDHESHTHILGSAFAVRREVYEQFGIESYSEAFAEDWVLMNQIEADPYWYNGLPLEELANNYGMGLGNSTVALADPESESGIKTASIHKHTYRINGGGNVGV